MSDNDSDIDDFAQNILQRARLRNEMINSLKKTDGTAPVTLVFTEKNNVTEDLKVKTDEKMPKQELISTNANVKQTAGLKEVSLSEEENKSPISSDEEAAPVETVEFSVPVGQKKVLKKLGELYGGNMISSPAHSHTEGEKTPEWTPVTNSDSISTAGRRTRLNALARKINDWEDDLTHYVSPSSRFNVSPPKQNRKSTFSMTSTSELVTEAQGFVSNENRSKLTYDFKKEANSPSKHVSKRDESPSPTRGRRSLSSSPVRSKPVGSPVRNMGGAVSPIREVQQPKLPSPSKSKSISSIVTTGISESTAKASLSVAQKTALFESKGPSTSFLFGESKDPSELSVAQRAKLFEQQALAGNNSKSGSYNITNKPTSTAQKIIKPPFKGTSSPNKKNELSFALPKGSVQNQRRLFESGVRSKEIDPTMEIEEEEEMEYADCDDSVEEEEEEVKKSTLPDTPPPPFVPPPPPLPPSNGNLSITFSAISSSPTTGSRSRSSSPKKKEVFKLPQSTTPKRAASPSPTRSRSTSPRKSNYPGVREVKRIRVNEPKPGKMYPSLTDIESTETETEGEAEFDVDYTNINGPDEGMESEVSHVSGCSSLGTQIERVARENSGENYARTTPRRNRHYRPTEDFSTSLACRQIDALIGDALEGQDFSLDTINEEELNVQASSTPVSTPSELTNVKRDEESNPHWNVSSELARFSSHSEEDDRDETMRESFDSISNKNASVIPNPNYKKVLETEIDEINNDVEEDKYSEDASSSFTFHSNISQTETNDSNDERNDSSPIVASSPIHPNSRKSGQVISLSPPQKQSVGSPLVHTVSFFRKQQEQQIVTPRKKLEPFEPIEEVPSPQRKAARVDNLNDKIKKLEDEVGAQLRSISQVSKALNLCLSTVEFSDSTENVECEKVLLVATQKRLGLLNEIHRLKTEGALTRIGSISPSKNSLGPSCQGNMTISDVGIEFKRDFISKALSGDTIFNFITLVKYRNQLEASNLISVGHGISSTYIQNGVLHFPNSFHLNSLDPDFQVRLEVYCLQTLREFLPHEAKYHIKKESKKMTPKKGKKDSKLSRHFQQSPAGPDTVRSTKFTLNGSLTIDIGTLRRSHWALEGVRFTSPLEGNLSMKIQCSAEGGVEHTGFLTLFDDVSGFGAWERRWAKLTSTHLLFWMYPEHEAENMEPRNKLSLRHCVTTRVAPAHRDICARANAFYFVTTRSPIETDKNSLITSCHGDYTAVRHLMTADTREERDEWCVGMNKALANIRAWDPQAHSPDDTLF